MYIKCILVLDLVRINVQLWQWRFIRQFKFSFRVILLTELFSKINNKYNMYSKNNAWNYNIYLFEKYKKHCFYKVIYGITWNLALPFFSYLFLKIGHNSTNALLVATTLSRTKFLVALRAMMSARVHMHECVQMRRDATYVRHVCNPPRHNYDDVVP
jgi:hypothetical protein